MAAVRTTLRASDLPDNLAQLRSSIERGVPVGNGPGGEQRKLPDAIERQLAQSGLVARLDAIKAKHRKIRTDKLDRQIGTDRKSTRLNSSHSCASRMPSSA